MPRLQIKYVKVCSGEVNRYLQFYIREKELRAGVYDIYGVIICFVVSPATMDDHDILKLKKIPGKKRRSRNSVSSSCTLVKENFELNQLLDGENTMVYALVEILKDSEETARREKIPLNDRDLIIMMQKFMSSKKEKLDRKILRPSLKRKLGLEYGESNSKVLKEQKNLATCELANQSLGLSDNLSCKFSNHSVYSPTCNKDRYRRRQATKNDHKISDQENEPSDLKILYNRNATERRELKVKRERTNSVSRGTNTDIVQTPKVLGEVLQALNLNMDNGSEDRQKVHSEGRIFAEDGGNSVQTPVQNFLLVPFIVSNKIDGNSKKIDNNSHEFDGNGESRCSNCSRLVEHNSHRREMIQAVRSHKSVTDLRNGTRPLNLQTATSSGIKINYSPKNGILNGDEKIGTSIELEEGRERGSIKRECFLEEVKTLQTKLNEIIKGLETRNLIVCQNNCGAFRKEENGKIDYHMKSAEDESSLFGGKCSDHEKCGKTEMISPREPSPVREEAASSQDFSVQVALTKSSFEKAANAPSESTFEKILRLDKPSQFPSEAKMEPRAKRPRRRTLGESKSTPLFRTNIEYRIVKTKRTSSLQLSGKLIQPFDYIKLKKLKLKFEGSRPDNGDMFEEELRPPEDEKLKLEHSKPGTETGNTADVLFKKKSFVAEPEGEKEVITTVKPTGKIAKIKIIGNTALSDKSPNSGIGKIKLELDGANTIQISNKLTRRMITNISNSNSNSSESATNNSNSNIDDDNRSSSNIDNNTKELENNKKYNGNGKVDGNNKFVKKEAIAKKGNEATRPAKPKSLLNGLESNQSQTGVKVSKLKKPMTPVRAVPKGKENGSSKAIGQKIQSPSLKTEEVQAAQPPEKIKSLEKPLPLPEKKIESIEHCEPDKKANLAPNDIPCSLPDESDKAVTQKSSCPQSKEDVSPPEKLDKNPDRQSEAVKSIWALTKVILYKDGTQSFQVLEASSSPPGYHLSQNKKKEVGENSDSKTAVVINNNIDKNENNGHSNCFNSVGTSS